MENICNCQKNKGIEGSKDDPEYVSKKNFLKERLINCIKKIYTKKLVGPLLACLLGLLLGLVFFFLGMIKGDESVFGLLGKDKQRMLVLAGGGSVAAYLDVKYHDKFKKENYFSNNNYSNAVYLHMPSEDALKLLAEEAIMPYSLNNQPFYPVCFSSKQAKDSLFTIKCTEDQMKRTGYIVEHKLGDEKLAIYIEEQKEKLSIDGDITASKITVKQLVTLLRSDKYNIFCTSPQSGTYYAYYQLLMPEEYDLSAATFYQYSSQTSLPMLQSPSDKEDRKDFILLGSDFYWPKSLKDEIDHNKARKLFIVNENDPDQLATRPMYIYFLAYRKEIDRKDHYFIPGEVLKLLKDLNINNNELIKDKELTILDTKKLIVPI